MCLEKVSGCSEFKLLNNFFLVVDELLEIEMVCLEGIEGLGIFYSGGDIFLDIWSNKVFFNGMLNEMVYKRNYNIDGFESNLFK